ncbi:receptor activity-modifying protein 2 [Pelobates fuscus]|uniref:receptor activity-modifying protein 2 n=1 Tax=Pelobates fuscus TaxID=191477 RepID=UPI002FE49E3C
MARKNPRMEYRILSMVTNMMILFIWASCSVTAQKNATVSPVTTSNPTDIFNSSAKTREFYVENAEFCWRHYVLMMSKVESGKQCEWQEVNRPYSFLRDCLESLADTLRFAFPNEIAHDYIMMGHLNYFVNCSSIFQELIDPPEHILLALIFAPISIIPFLVTLVVCKSKTSEPQA